MTRMQLLHRGALLGALVLAAAAAVAAAPKAKPAAGTKSAASKARLPRLVDLGAHECVPCKMMVPVLDALRREQAGQIEVVFIDVWKDPAAGKPYKIRLIPTQVLYDAQGKEFARHEGYWPKEDILAAFRKQGVKLGAAGPAKGKP